MWKYILILALSAGVLIETWIVEANGQSTWCPPGSTIVPLSYGNTCRCPDGTLANINGCVQHQNQTYVPPQRYVPPPPQNYIPPREQQVASAAEALGNLVDWLFTSPQFDATTYSGYNPAHALNVAQQNNNALQVPPNFFDKYTDTNTPPKTNVTQPNSFNGLQDVKKINPTSPAQAPSAPQTLDTPLPPPGQLGVNQNVTGFQQETNVSTPNQTWFQKATNWVGCSLLTRC